MERPYNFNDNGYDTYCSYKPAQIEFNIMMEKEAAGTEGRVLGWGHTSKYRHVSKYILTVQFITILF